MRVPDPRRSGVGRPRRGRAGPRPRRAADRPARGARLAHREDRGAALRRARRRARSRRADLSRARAFNLDELRLPAGHPASFHAYMTRHAWGPLGLDPARCDIPDPEAEPGAECARYDRALAARRAARSRHPRRRRRRARGLQPAGADGRGTHLVELPETLADALGVPPDRRPLRAITMGLGPLRAARRLLLLATGADKARAVRQLVDGPARPRLAVLPAARAPGVRPPAHALRRGGARLRRTGLP